MCDIKKGNFHRVTPEQFTKGLILELCEIGKAWPDRQLRETIHEIAPKDVRQIIKPETLRTKVIRLKQKAKKLRKGTKAYEELVNAAFSLDVQQPLLNGELSSRSNQPSPQPTQHCTLPSPAPTEETKQQCTPSTCTLSKQVNQTQHLLTKKEKKLKRVEQQIEEKKATFGALGHFSKRNVNKRDKRAKEGILSLKEAINSP